MHKQANTKAIKRCQMCGQVDYIQTTCLDCLNRLMEKYEQMEFLMAIPGTEDPEKARLMVAQVLNLYQLGFVFPLIAEALDIPLGTCKAIIYGAIRRGEVQKYTGKKIGADKQRIVVHVTKRIIKRVTRKIVVKSEKAEKPARPSARPVEVKKARPARIKSHKSGKSKFIGNPPMGMFRRKAVDSQASAS